MQQIELLLPKVEKEQTEETLREKVTNFSRKLIKLETQKKVPKKINKTKMKIRIMTEEQFKRFCF